MLSTGGVISDLAGPCALIMFVGAKVAAIRN